MSEIKTRADLFEAAAKMMRMCDEAGIGNTYKVKGFLCVGEWQMNLPLNFYEFPIAILEGRPVFVGDELWGKDGCKHEITGLGAGTCTYAAKDGWFAEDYLSWNPPKPCTIMVELSEKTVDSVAKWFKYEVISDVQEEIIDCCKKAILKPKYADNLKAGLEQEERVKIDLTRQEAETLSKLDDIPMFLVLLIKKALDNR